MLTVVLIACGPRARTRDVRRRHAGAPGSATAQRSVTFRSASVNAYLTCSCVQLAHVPLGAFTIPLPRDFHLIGTT
jgi:hypothetical protein